MYIELRFGGGGAGQFNENGEEAVEVYALDEFIFEELKINIIKMDVEGYEMPILKGARNTIEKVKPILILSAYHHPYDIYCLVDYIRGIVDDYKIYLRHYTDSYADSVLYFIP